MTDTNVLAVIVNYRTPELAAKCLAALARERTSDISISAILVDGGSDDGSAGKLAKVVSRDEFRDWVEFLPLDFNGGFGWANNQAVLHKSASETGLPEFLYFLNPDAEVTPGAVSSLRRIFDRDPRIGIVGSQLQNADDGRPASSFRFPSIGREFIRGSDTYRLHRLTGIKPTVMNIFTAGPAEWVTGASMMVRRQALADTGLFDDGFFLYFEEVELMYRMKTKGWSVWHEPNSVVTHIGGASTGVTQYSEPTELPNYWYNSRNRFFTRRYGRLGAFSANVAWLVANYTIGKLRQLFSDRASARSVLDEARGMCDAGIWPRKSDVEASFPVMNDRPGTLPSWSRRV